MVWNWMRMNNRCWGFRGARLMLPSPSSSLPAMSALILIGERGTPNHCRTPVMSIAGIGCRIPANGGVGWQSTFSSCHKRWFSANPTCYLALHWLPSYWAGTKQRGHQAGTGDRLMSWRFLAISALLSANAAAFTPVYPTITPSSGSRQSRAQSMVALNRWTERGWPCLTPCDTLISSLWSGPMRRSVQASL